MNDYKRFVRAAKNGVSDWIPLYDHIVAPNVIEDITGNKFAGLIDEAGLNEYFKNYNAFFDLIGYDAIPFECIIAGILPGNRRFTDTSRVPFTVWRILKNIPGKKLPAFSKKLLSPIQGLRGEPAPRNEGGGRAGKRSL
jgi:uroporphyrinogen decarboxylase